MTHARAHHTPRVSWLIALALHGTVAIPLCAQDPPITDESRSVTSDQVVEAYIERLNLRALHAQQLEELLAKAPRDRRTAIAERLARVYVDLLAGARSGSDRERWEQRARAMLAQTPEADSIELRISLARANYVRAEDISERHRLRLATVEEVSDAERQLRALAQTLQELGYRASSRVEQLERVEQQGDTTEKLQEELALARRQRSSAFYFAGWSNVYLALITKTDAPAVEAQRQFGWLLNSSGGRPASLDRVQPSMFQYEHVARAAIGCSLAASLRGSDVEAIRWLDAVEEAPGTSQAVRDQLLSRRMAVLGQAKRWADLELLVRRQRQIKERALGAAHQTKPLPVLLARLLAVITLEADKSLAAKPIEQLASIALADLVALREVAQILDLVGKYGTTPLGDTGFIVHYVRALQAYERARTAHQSEGNSDEPTSIPATATDYRTAASLFTAAMQQSDVKDFAVDSSRAGIMLGRSLFMAGDFLAAADALLASHKALGTSVPQGTDAKAWSSTAEESLWLAVLSLERAARTKDADLGLKSRLSEVVTLYLRSFPDSERAPRLVLMQVSLGELSDDEAIKVLSAVASTSPMYEPARRQLARILYSKFRAARGTDRDFIAAQFIVIAEQVMASDQRTAMAQDKTAAAEAVERVITRARQLLDALLTTSTPDASRAQNVLKVLQGVAAFNASDLTPHAPELLFRELQIALVLGNDSAAEAHFEKLANTRDPSQQFLAAAERAMYRSTAQKYKPADTSEEGYQLARRVVSFGVRVIDRMGSSRDALKEPGALGLYSSVASAARDAFKRDGDVKNRDLAIRLDKSLLQVQPRLEVALRRLAEMSEAAEDHAVSLSCWRTLHESQTIGSEFWFETRYEFIRVLNRLDGQRARRSMNELLVLFKDFGPEPWGSRLRELDAQLPALAPVLPAAPGPPSTPALPITPPPEGQP